MFANIFAIAASLVGLWAFVKYIIMVEIRVDENTYKTLYDYFKNEKHNFFSVTP